MGWKIEEITAKRLETVRKRFPEADSAVLDHIAAVEAALYCLAYPLSELDIERGPRRAAWMTSKLFPATYFDNIPEGQFAVWDKATSEFVAKEIKLEELHEHEYQEAESISIEDGSRLADDLEVLAVHQNAIAAYVYGGSISMGDIRRAVKLLWPE